MLTDLIIYDLKVAALIAIFYLFYMLLLSRETMHKLNRIVLLSGIILSAVLPFCVITFHKTVVVDSSLTPAAVDADVDTTLPVTEALEQSFDWTIPLVAMLLIGTIVRLLFLIRSYRQLTKMVRGGEIHILPTGTQVCVVEEAVAPFSWMKTIVLSRTDWNNDATLPTILAHEEAHVRHRHSYDIMVVELLTALQWFNPVVWFMRQELRILHEYEADADVLSYGFNESQYIHLLMQKAMGIQACVLANGIHTPKTKKRIIMMLKNKSNRHAWLRALYVVPVVLVSLAVSAKTLVHYEYETTPEPDKNTAVRIIKNKTYGDAYQIRYQSGVKFFRNGKEELIPKGRSIALEVAKTTMMVNGKSIEQMNLLDLPIGALKEIYLTEQSSDKYVCNIVTEQKKGKRVYIVNGKESTEAHVEKIRTEDITSVDVVETRETIKNVYNVDADEAVAVQTRQAPMAPEPPKVEANDDPVFEICEEAPRYKDGEEALMQFIAKNIRYPKEATEHGIQGRVIVQFIVNKDGSCSNFKILTNTAHDTSGGPVVTQARKAEIDQQQGIETEYTPEEIRGWGKSLETEAIRVLKLAGKWEPGKQRGKAVRAYFVLPITFRLQ